MLDRFYNTTPNETWFNPPLGLIKQEYKSWEHAKEIAFICVEEILSVKLLWYQADTYDLDYWKQVKTELEKL